MKRVFGKVEVIFDLLYMVTASILGIILFFRGLSNVPILLTSIMTFVLVLGDMFHLIPRIKVIVAKNEEKYRSSLGIGKQITSITMSLFYLLFWYLGLLLFNFNNVIIWTIIITILVIIRITICLLPQNKWNERYPPVKWSVIRNIPFVLEGLMVATLFFIFRNQVFGFNYIWLAIIISFGFYLPVVLWANKNPKLGMFMLPKTIAYIWMIIIFLSL